MHCLQLAVCSLPQSFFDDDVIYSSLYKPGHCKAPVSRTVRSHERQSLLRCSLIDPVELESRVSTPSRPPLQAPIMTDDWPIWVQSLWRCNHHAAAPGGFRVLLSQLLPRMLGVHLLLQPPGSTPNFMMLLAAFLAPGGFDIPPTAPIRAQGSGLAHSTGAGLRKR